MNLYLRFFNEEVLVESVGQAVDFIMQIPDIKVEDAVIHELTRYAEGNNPYPKRFKVSSKVYFIVIKTTARTMEEFKAYAAGEGVADKVESEKESMARALGAENPGWYQVAMKFKRVVVMEDTGKCCYMDTDFEARLKAHSVQDCYNRVVDHLRNRPDVDPRSQFPSIRGRNFRAEFLGM